MPDDAGARREAIDVLRVLALAVVVAGHLSLAVIDRVDGELRGTNLLTIRPGWAWVTVIAPMPVFFAAAGWANATATPARAAPRLRTLAGLAAIAVGAWSTAVVAATVIAGESGIVGDGARVATQPLWFLAAYVPMAANGRRLAAWAARRPLLTLVGPLGVLGAIDVARFGLGWPEWMAWAGFALAWGLPWMIGAWWRSVHHRDGFSEWRVGLGFAAAGGLAAWSLVRWGGYSPALIDAVPGARSNTTPPTLYTAMVGLAQVGSALIIAKELDAVGRRARGFWDRAGEAAVGVYVWHLTALALCAATLMVLPAPVRFGAAWWLTRPLWWGAVLGLTFGLVAVSQAVRQRAAHPRSPLPARPWGTGAGLTFTTVAAAGVGLVGPRTLPTAIIWSALFLAGWWLLRPPAGGGRQGPRLSRSRRSGRAGRGCGATG